MADPFDPAELEARVARVDPDRQMAAKFAPREARARLTALYAFNYEIARVRERVTEPAIGDMRLAWWREAIDEIYNPDRIVRWHEVAQALQEAFADNPPPRLWIDRMINARARDLDAQPFATLRELRDYAEATAGTLMRVGVWLLAPGAELTPQAEGAITHAGVAWALAGMIRALPVHTAQGRPGLAVDLTELMGAGPDDDSGWRKALAPIMDLARQEYGFASEGYGLIPPACAPACLYAVLVPRYLQRAEQRRDPLRDSAELSPLERQVRMVAAAARGRI